MANQEHLAILKQGVETWNAWRRQHVEVEPDLSDADLCGCDLRGGYFSGANLSGADLSEADVRDAELGWVELGSGYYHAGANLSFAQLQKADCRNARFVLANLMGVDARGVLLTGANLRLANVGQSLMSETDMRQAKLQNADFSNADLRGADLREADLSYAHFHGADLSGANLRLSRLDGLDAWGVRLEDTIQLDLVVTPPQIAPVTVDHIQIAQFVCFYQRSTKLREVLDVSPSSRLVLLVGGFTGERKQMLETIKTALRQHNIIPIFYDITQEKERNIEDYLPELVSLVRFVLVDVSEPASFLRALEPLVPTLPAVPLHMIMQAPKGGHESAEFFEKYPWVTEPQYYHGADDLADLVGTICERKR